MQFRVLGPIEVQDGAQPLTIAGSKQRALLALLLLRANEVVSRATLIDALWGAEPPRDAEHSLESQVFRLRKLLHRNGEDVVLTRSTGYVLRIDDGELDLARFERLADQGRAELRAGHEKQAIELLREALSLWRGSVLEDVDLDSAAVGEMRSIEDRRLSVCEDLMDAELECGRHAEVLPELERLVRLNPLREPFHRQLMLALYRSDRQADALEAYRTARRRFADELGIELGPELRELEQAILRQDPALDLPVPHDEAPGESPAVVRSRRPRLGIALVAVAFTAAAAGFLLTRGSPGVAVAPNSVAVIDPASNKVVDDVKGIGRNAGQILYGQGAVWLASKSDQTIARINPRTSSVSTFGPGFSPSYLADGFGKIWVSGGTSGTVAAIDPQDDSTAPIQLPHTYGSPSADGIAAGPDGVWVYDSADLALFRINPQSLRVDKRLPPGTVGNESPTPIAVRGGALWYLCCWTGSAVAYRNHGQAVERLDLETRSLKELIIGDGSPTALALRGDALWITLWPHQLARINALPPGTLVSKSILGGRSYPASVAVDKNAVWVANERSRTVSRIDPDSGQVVKTIKLGRSPSAIAVGGGRVWVAVGSA